MLDFLGIIRKHEYSAGWPNGKCKHCNRRTGLDYNQLINLFPSMAKCQSLDAKYISFIEYLTNNVRCVK